LSQIYRIGAGDVLDVQLVDMPTSKSTLFTVQGGGKLEYPLAGDPLSVVGLTTDEIATRLRASIKVFDHPRVLVRVRDYASHNVAVSGAVANPGTKALRREAVPLYVLLAEAQPQTEASRVTVSRSGQAPINLDLNDQRSAATLVQPGDEIKVFGAPAAPPAYFYISGAVNSTGQKAFHSGLTLTQAIIASGGLSRGASGRAKILRQGADGKLAATEFNLRQIDDGRIVDPALLPGDRIAAP
jgi:protein involved in polysaccharide export with SLBB domain